MRQRKNAKCREEILHQSRTGCGSNSNTVPEVGKEVFQGTASERNQSHGMKRSYTSGVIVLLLAFGAYGNSIHGEFLHDDNPAVLQNPDVQGKSSLVEVFFKDFWGTQMTSNKSHKSHRPICVLTFRLEHFIFGFNPVPFHITNVCLHSVVSMLVFVVCRNTIFANGYRGKQVECMSLACGALFALHPIHTEAVANLVGRAELISALFYLLAFLLHDASLDKRSIDENILKRTGKRKHERISKGGNRRKDALMLVLALLTSGCATFSKETGITILGTMFLREFHSILWRQTKTSKKLSDLLWPLIRVIMIASWTLTLTYVRLSLMGWILPQFATPDNPASKSPNIQTRFLTYCLLLWLNFKLLVFPKDLLYDWSYGTVPLVTSPFDSRNVISAAFAALSVSAILIILLKDLPKSRISTRLYGLFLLILPYIPASNVIFPVGFVIAERTLYLPSLGYVILLTVIWEKLHSWCYRARGFMKFLLFLLLMTYYVRTWRRNEDWSNKKNLFESAVRVAPQNAKVRYNWANYLRDIGKYDGAAKEYEATLKLYPSYAGALNNLATILEMNESTLVRAEELYVRLIRLEPTRVDAYRNLADILVKTKRYSAAVQVYTRLLDNVGSHVSHVLALAELLRKSNALEHAERLFLRVLTQFCEVWKQGRVIELLRNISSRKHITISQSNCLQDSSEIPVALSQYTSLLFSVGSLTESVVLLNFSLSLNDSHVDSLVLLGWVKYKEKKFTESTKYLTRAAHLDKTYIDQAWKLAEFHYRQGRVEECKDLLKSLAELDSENTHLVTQYGFILNKSGDRQRAFEVLSKVTENDRNCENIGAWMELAKILETQPGIRAEEALFEKCLGKLNDHRGKQARIIEDLEDIAKE